MIFQWVTQAAGRGKILLLASVLLLSATDLRAQTSNRITLSRRQIPLSELFRQIERQTGSVVVGSSRSIDDSRTVTLPAASGTLDEVLGYALAGTEHRYQIYEGYIVIDKKTQEPPKARTQPQTLIIINDGELQRFVPEQQPGMDSIVRRVVDPGPFLFGADDKLFHTPGSRMALAPTATERWQRTKFTLKTNLLYGAGALTPNLRAEFGMGNRTTLETGVAYNGNNLNGAIGNNKKLVHGIAMAEFRYWLCERFYGHFFGAHAFGGFYNAGGWGIPLLFEKEFRYEGTVFGAGISYGYTLPLSARWGIGFNVGAGVAQLRYDKYGCEKCDQLENTYNKTYFGPTRAAVNLVFIIK